MKITNDFLGEIEYTNSDVVTFIEGLFGFSKFKEYVHIENPDPQFPFGWLQSVTDTNTSFVVTNPFLFVQNYDFEIPDSIIEKLEIESIDELTVLTLVVIPDNPEETTINLKSPVIMNSRTRLAKQVILEEEYKLKYKIFKKDENSNDADIV